MKTITKVALSNDKQNKTRSVLIILSIILTTALLTIIFTSANGMIKLQKENAATSYGSYYGVFQSLTTEQLQEVTRRAEISEIGLMSSTGIIEGNEKGNFASVDDSMLQMLPYNIEYQLESGNYPKESNEIAAGQAFFESIGQGNIQVGDIVTLSYRSGMSESYGLKEFVVSGILSDRGKYEIDNSYIVLASPSFYELQYPDENRQYNVYFRLSDAINVSMNNIDSLLLDIAKSCKIEGRQLIINNYYLAWMLDPSYEMIAVSSMLSITVILFSVIVIYNIFQVGIIQKVQEYGKIKALGATKTQMRGLIFREGMLLAIVAIPIGLFIGFFIAQGGFYWLVEQDNAVSVGSQKVMVELFSIPMLLISAVISVVTVILALRKPMKIVAGITPIEATRYQENASYKKHGVRQGKKEVSIFSLAMANVTGNRKRTIGTILTMGLSCVLFVAIANCVGNIDVEYDARLSIEYGQFEIKLDYSTEVDEMYTENNLDVILSNNPLNKELIKKIKAISGVTDVITRDIMVADVNGMQQVISVVNQKDFENMRSDLDIGNMSYEDGMANGSIYFGWAMWMEADGYALNQPVTLEMYNGTEKITYQGVLAGSFVSADTSWILPIEVYATLQSSASSTGYLWVDCDEADTTYVKQELNKLLDNIAHVKINTYEDALSTSELASRMIKMGCYLFMGIIGLIGFMNLANTMIISIATKKQEYGVLQAVGMTNRQLNKSLQLQGLIFTVGTIIVALGVGLPLGYGLFSYAKKNGIFGMNVYHIPVVPILVMIVVIATLQLILSFVLSRNLKKETLVERIRYQR